jgi:hypothetical protein
MPQPGAESAAESVGQDAAGCHCSMKDPSAESVAVCLARSKWFRLSYAFNFPKTPSGV